jgi:hypothetical protein
MVESNLSRYSFQHEPFTTNRMQSEVAVMARIGVDFDNTIACYDRTFVDVALTMGMITDAVTLSKRETKKLILSRPDGELDWQRLQGQVYGKYMLQAEVFPGFLEFLCLTKVRGNEIFVVSHKSEFGHFDEERYPLREQALLWLQATSLFDENDLGLSRENVFFESTQEDKVRRIRDLDCDYFVDDLLAVFEEPGFPGKTQRILFCPNYDGPHQPPIVPVSSWRETTKQLYGEATESDICHIAQIKFPMLGVMRAELRKGRGNSRIYELLTESGKGYALKVYPDRQRDPRPRLETEFSAHQELLGRGYPVSGATAADKNLGWGIFPWVSGSQIQNVDDRFVSDATDFLNRLYVDSRGPGAFSQFHQASEACLSGAEIARQIQGRLQRLMGVESEELQDFLCDQFHPLFILAVQVARQECGERFETELPLDLQMPSPSDFGSHNALQSEGGRSIFIDFEYFGWDDPVKLVADFCWHPGMRLPSHLRERWILNCRGIFAGDTSFPLRLKSYSPLYGLRWCLILLNEFLSLGAGNRIHANPQKGSDLAEIRRIQLNKSRAMLQTIKQGPHHFGSPHQWS